MAKHSDGLREVLEQCQPGAEQQHDVAWVSRKDTDQYSGLVLIASS